MMLVKQLVRMIISVLIIAGLIIGFSRTVNSQYSIGQLAPGFGLVTVKGTTKGYCHSTKVKPHKFYVSTTGKLPIGITVFGSPGSNPVFYIPGITGIYCGEKDGVEKAEDDETGSTERDRFFFPPGEYTLSVEDHNGGPAYYTVNIYECGRTYMCYHDGEEYTEK